MPQKILIPEEILSRHRYVQFKNNKTKFLKEF
jgi:hypothetical protein